MLGGRDIVTAVCALPGYEAVLAGFSTGAILFSELDDMAKPRLVKRFAGPPVTTMAVTPSDGWLFAADEEGDVLWAPLWTAQ